MPTKAAPKKPAARKAADTVYHRRSAALTLLQQAGKWKPFYGPTGRLLWQVPSEKPPKKGETPVSYVVFVGDGPEPLCSCTCPDAQYPRPERVAGYCKHVIAVRSFQRAAKAYTRHMAALAAALGG